MVRKKLDYYKKYDSNTPLFKQLFRANLFSTSAVVCKRCLLEDVGGFDEGLMSAQDYELWLRLSPKITPHFLPECLGEYIHREGNITSTSINRRITNELKIAFRYRDMASKKDLFLRITRILLSFGLQIVRRLL